MWYLVLNPKFLKKSFSPPSDRKWRDSNLKTDNTVKEGNQIEI